MATDPIDIPELEDANLAATANSVDCTLILTQGYYAMPFAMSGLSVVGRDYYGVFPLEGKLLNVSEASPQQLHENADVQNIIKILGLQHGKIYENVKELRYGCLMIMADPDHEGLHFKGLLINFFHSFWPSLLKVPNFICEFKPPIIKAFNKQTKKVLQFYTKPEYEAWKENLGNKTAEYRIRYYKGLDTFEIKEGAAYFADLDHHIRDFVWVDDEEGDAIELAFGTKNIQARKNWVCTPQAGIYLDLKKKHIRYCDFINKEFKKYLVADLRRSIPSMVDGLKHGPRKILFCAFKNPIILATEVAKFSCYVSAHSAYHQGEASLAGTIIGMAQNYVASNNINLFHASGQFGTRQVLSPITRYLFHKADELLLNYLNEDYGQSIEPEWFIPIIPMVLVNGSEATGTEWSSFIPNYNPRDIIANLKRLLNGEAMVPMHPWYKWFNDPYTAHNKLTTLSTANMVLFDANGVIKKYDTPEQILEDFFHLRLDFYEKRRTALLREFEKASVLLENKVKFIREIVEGTIALSTKKDDLYAELKDKGYTPLPKETVQAPSIAGAVDHVGREETEEVAEGDEYDYLLCMDMPLWKMQKLPEEWDAKKKERDELTNTLSKSLWLRDLDALDHQLDGKYPLAKSPPEIAEEALKKKVPAKRAAAKPQRANRKRRMGE